jgi:hypothetical protein
MNTENAIYKPSEREVNYWVKETLDHWNSTMPENRPSKLKRLQDNLQRMESQLADKNNDSFYEAFPIGECNRELKIKYEATKKVLKKINSLK